MEEFKETKNRRKKREVDIDPDYVGQKKADNKKSKKEGKSGKPSEIKNKVGEKDLNQDCDERENSDDKRSRIKEESDKAYYRLIELLKSTKIPFVCHECGIMCYDIEGVDLSGIERFTNQEKYIVRVADQKFCKNSVNVYKSNHDGTLSLVQPLKDNKEVPFWSRELSSMICERVIKNIEVIYKEIYGEAKIQIFQEIQGARENNTKVLRTDLLVDEQQYFLLLGSLLEEEEREDRKAMVFHSPSPVSTLYSIDC